MGTNARGSVCFSRLLSHRQFWIVCSKLVSVGKDPLCLCSCVASFPKCGAFFPQCGATGFHSVQLFSFLPVAFACHPILFLGSGQL